MRALAWMVVALGMMLTAIHAEDPSGPFKPSIRYATIVFPGIHVHVPMAQAEILRPVAARAAAIYARMCLDAGYAPDETLHVVLNDDEDDHNGFSTVLPLALINVQLGPSRPEATFFTGDDETARTLIHEFAHHLSNERNRGVHGVLSSIFGRVLPSDPLSLFVFMFTTPNHVLSPAFWHEGLAQWAETAYADPTSAWGGRGRDSLTHMIWRLDTAAQGPDPASDWRLSHVRWPYGSEAYIYGIAYTRWLSGAFGDRRGLWRMVDHQSRLNTPFAFDDGSLGSVGYTHDALISMARTALAEEQQRALANIATHPITALTRLTPTQWNIAAPAWISDDDLWFSAKPPTARPALYRLTTTASAPDRLSHAAWSLGSIRRIAAGLTVRAVPDVGSDDWGRSQIYITSDTQNLRLARQRLLEPDARTAGDDSFDVAAIALQPAAIQELVIARAVSGGNETWTTVPTEGRPWTPAFRPGTDELVWVETDRMGSRLVLAAFDGSQRRVLWQIRGRILHPVWSADGTRVFCASDTSGVANGWCIQLAGNAQPVTNTIGGVLAVVPSPDGKRLAILDHDVDGPFIGVMSSDSATWPQQIAQIPNPWPAPVARLPLGAEANVEQDQADPIGPVPAQGGDPPQAIPYDGFAELRMRYWTPTTYAVPEGGFGVVGFATDPLLTHQVIASFGTSYAEHVPVGLASWTYTGWDVDVSLLAKRSALNYDQQAVATNGLTYDYDETVATYEARIGWGLAGSARRFHGWLAVGIDAYQPITASASAYDGWKLASPQPFIGIERYVEATIAYNSTMLFPTSYAREDGANFAITARSSDSRGDRVIATASYSLPVWPEGGHQIVLVRTIGWSDGKRDLQGRFGVGGDAVLGQPRGYPLTMSRGRTFEAASVAYRFPFQRHFAGCGTTPLVMRQLVCEGFYDTANSGDTLGDGSAFRSCGIELHAELEFWLVRLAPGFGVARQVDGDEDTVSYLTLGFRW